MTTLITETQNSLNPAAPEFFPCIYNNYQQIIQIPSYVDHLHQCPNPSAYYYSSSLPLPSPCLRYTTTYHFDVVSQNPGDVLVPQIIEHARPFMAISEQTHLVSEAQVAETEQAITNETVSRRSHAKRGGHMNRCFERGGHHDGFNRRGRGYTGHENQRAKKDCRRAKFNGNRNARPSLGGSKRNHPVVLVEPDGQNTTVMIRNIPNRYTRELLMEFLDTYCMEANQKAKLQQSDSINETILSAFDFLYLPMDFEKGANKGYAFVNFTDARAVWKFHLAAHNKTWDLFQSNKIREIAYARIQGKEELVRHFDKSTFECESDMYLPVCFSPARDGSGVMVKQTIVGRRIG